MKITKRQLRKIVREAIDGDFFSDREANPHDGSMYGEPEGGYGADDLGIVPGDEVLILPPGSSHGTVHVQVVEVLPKTVLVRDEAGYEFEIPHHDVLEKSTGQFNPVIREARDSYGRLDTHNMSPNEAAELMAVLQEFGYSLFISPTANSNTTAINDALMAYPSEFTYDELRTAISIAQGRGT